jgi:hypothetical protein
MALKLEKGRPLGGLDINGRIILKQVSKNMKALTVLIWLRLGTKCGFFEHFFY